MVVIPPGIDLLARGLVSLVVFVGVITSVNSLVTTRLGYVIPTWMVLLGAAVSIPMVSTIYVLALKFRNARRASAMGARLIPEVQGKMLGNFDVLKQMMDNFKHGYPGKILSGIANLINFTTYTSVLKI